MYLRKAGCLIGRRWAAGGVPGWRGGPRTSAGAGLCTAFAAARGCGGGLWNEYSILTLETVHEHTCSRIMTGCSGDARQEGQRCSAGCQGELAGSPACLLLLWLLLLLPGALGRDVYRHARDERRQLARDVQQLHVGARHAQQCDRQRRRPRNGDGDDHLQALARHV